MKYIKLENSEESATVDDCCYPELNKHDWFSGPEGEPCRLSHGNLLIPMKHDVVFYHPEIVDGAGHHETNWSPDGEKD